jgi:putative ABC transport system substrate-binding protein
MTRSSIRRREFITLLGGAAAAWPRAVTAQQLAMPVVGYLDPGTPEQNADVVTAFRQGLSAIGYVEGSNVAIEYRWAQSQYGRLPALATELVRRQVAVIAATNGIPSVSAAKAATNTIPIVFYVGVDPVAFGVVTSLNRPGGNVTGVTGLGTELGPKRLELLHELVPGPKVLAALINPGNAAGVTQSNDLQAAARTLRRQLQILHASSDRELDTALAALVQMGAGGLVIGADGFFNSRFEQLAAFALRHAVPMIYQYRGFVAAGGLIRYGGSIADAYRLVGQYTGRILRGEKPADLPVQQATRVELIINMKTAKTLGLTFPLNLLGRADEVIE